MGLLDFRNPLIPNRAGRIIRGRRNWAYPQEVMLHGPVSYWRLGELAGTTAVDMMGANNGTYTATYTLGGDSGALRAQVCPAVSMATAGAVTLATFTGIPVGGNARTLEALVKPVNNGGTIMGYGDGPAGGQDFNLQVFNSGGTWYLFRDGINAGNDITLTGAEIPALGQWNHIVFALSSSTAWEYFLNGELAKSGTFGTAINTAAIGGARMGTRYDAAAQGLDGALAEVAIYAGALNIRHARRHYLAAQGALGG